MRYFPALFALSGALSLIGVALASPAGAQLSSTQVQFGPVLVAPTCELTPTAGALRYLASTPGRISSDGSPGLLSASLSGAVGTGSTASGPVIQFSNPAMSASGNSVALPPYAKQMKIGSGIWQTTTTMPFPNGSGTLVSQNVDVQFETTDNTAFPAGTYRATVDVSCFESAPAGS